MFVGTGLEAVCMGSLIAADQTAVNSSETSYFRADTKSCSLSKPTCPFDPRVTNGICHKNRLLQCQQHFHFV